MGIVSYTCERVFGEALKSICDEEVRFRKSLPVGFVEQDELIDLLKGQFSELLSVFAERANFENAIRRIGECFISTRHPLLSGQLCELKNVHELGGYSWVQKREGILSRLTAEYDAIHLLYHGKRILFPDYVGTALRFIVRRLVKESFLTIIREQDVLGSHGPCSDRQTSILSVGAGSL